MNSAQLIGRFTRDPEVKYTDSGTSVVRFTLACDRKYSREGEDSADFISCVAFGKTAEFIEKYFCKGKRMGLNGRIQTGSYTNKDDQKIYTSDVIAESVEFVESKGAGNSGEGTSQRPSPANDIGNGFISIPDGVEDEGLPFN